MSYMRYRATLRMLVSYMRYSVDVRIMVLKSCIAREQKFRYSTVFLLCLDVMSLKFKHYIQTTDLIITYCFKNHLIYVQSVWKVLI